MLLISKAFAPDKIFGRDKRMTAVDPKPPVDIPES
jgi:hypothetical protein